MHDLGPVLTAAEAAALHDQPGSIAVAWFAIPAPDGAGTVRVLRVRGALRGRRVFSREDFGRLADLLRGMRGRFLLSLNDTPEVRALFDGFEIEAVQTSYTIAQRGTKPVGEVLISGPG